MNTLTPEQIQQLKRNMAISKRNMISMYTISAIMLMDVILVHELAPNHPETPIICGIVGFIDCIIGDTDRRKYYKIRNLLKEHASQQKTK
ncbi:hypothetical protein HDR61_04190 [bacterium]|nr:hypothetical protein [bacterium]